DFILRIGLAPPIPYSNSTQEEWFTWSLECICAPFVFMVLGLGMTYLTVKSVATGTDQRLKWLPIHSRRFLVASGIVGTCVVFLTMWHHIHTVNTQAGVVNKDIDFLEQALKRSQGLTRYLIIAQASYNQTLQEAPASCGASNPVATQLVTMLAGALGSQLTQVDILLKLFLQSLDDGDQLLSIGRQDYLEPSHFWFALLPAIPVMMIGAAATVVSLFWRCQRRRGKTISKTDFERYAPYLGSIMAFAVITAAGFLYVSVVISGLCFNIDSNLVHLSESATLGSTLKSKYNVDAVVQHAARYYIAGTNVNPLITVLQNLQAGLHTVNNFYAEYEWVVNAAATSCSGLTNLNPKRIVDALLYSVGGAEELLNAEHLWPHYHNSVHEVVCRHTPKSMLLMWFTGSLLFLVIVPLKVIMIIRHFRDAEKEVDYTQLDELPLKAPVKDIRTALDGLDSTQQAWVLDQ
ncbi:unnamed protein product, partial [Polarella glacialis]